MMAHLQAAVRNIGLASSMLIQIDAGQAIETPAVVSEPTANFSQILLCDVPDTGWLEG